MKKLLLAVLATATIIISGVAQATSISVFEDFLVSDTGNIVYDQAHDLSYAVPIISGIEETQSLAGARSLVSTMTVDGYGGWRLPKEVAEDPNCISQNGNIGFSQQCRLGEMSNLYNSMRNPGVGSVNLVYDEAYRNSLYDVFVSGQGITGNKFQNYIIWMDNEFGDGYYTLTYILSNGSRVIFTPVSGPGSVMGVQNGNVANLSAVPVPAAVWLFGSGLMGLIAVSRRKEKETTA